MGSFQKKLKAAGDAWKAARERSASSAGGYTEYEDGRYMARINKPSIGESQSSGRLQITWPFVFEDGEYEGKTKLDFSGLETENNLYYLSERLKQLGYEPPESIEEIEDILEDVAKSKPLVKIRLKTKGEFQNVYIDKVFAGAGEEEGEASDDETETPEDETPEVEETEVEEVEEEEEEEEDDDEEEDAVELTVGMTVTADTSSGKQQGEVIEILEADGKVRVKLENGKTIRVSIEKLEVVEAMPDEPKAAPKGKGKGKK